jgi:hypothetical protein
MSIPHNLPGLLSVDEVVEWLKAAPRTYKWDALLIYDREKANQLLLQEYINRFSSDSFLEPITDTIVIDTDTLYEHIYDYLLDAPRLSFEDSSFLNSYITLSMNIMGGSQLSVAKQGVAPKHVTRIQWIDALQGPKLTAKVALESAPVTVGESHHVSMNIAAARDFQVTLVDDEFSRNTAGDFFKHLFEELDDAKKIYVLNTLEPVEEGDFLDPERGALRIYRAPGADLRASPTHGNGAILYFVAVKGTTETDVPYDETGWVYPLPNGYSSLVLLGNHSLIKKIIADGIRKLSANAEVEYQNGGNPDAAIGDVTVLSGEMQRSTWETSELDGFDTLAFEYGIPLADKASSNIVDFTVSTRDGMLVYRWKGSTSGGAAHATLTTTNPSATSTWSFSWIVEATCRFELIEQAVVLVRDENVHLDVSSRPVMPINDIHQENVPFLVGVVEAHLRSVFLQALDDLIAPAREINLFRLHGLLFRGEKIVDLRAVAYPTDLAMFGDVNQRQTTFEVEPLEPVVGPGSRTTFNITPPGSGGQEPSWSVETVKGFEGDTGSIDQNGEYTAPVADAIHSRAYTIVRIRASTDGYTSAALVRVVLRDIVVNPLVMISGLALNPSKLSAGTLDRGSLDWAVTSATGATLEPVDVEEHPEFDEGDYLYVPGRMPSGKPFSIDVVTVTNPRTKKSSSAYIVVNELPMAFSITIADTTGLPENQVQLQFGIDGTSGENTWELLAGGGQLSPDGLLTVDPTAAHRFSVIGASFLLSGVSFSNYLILPVPLVDLNEVQRLLA